KTQAVTSAFSNLNSYMLLLACIIFIPINWGIESYKWQLITAPIEEVSYITASKSVYTGLCVGNLAPGRATEFLAKILFFKPNNRPTITLLHFANGMFQLAVTILFGLISIFVFYQEKISEENSAALWIGILCMLLLSVFTFFILKFQSIQKWIVKKFERSYGQHALPYKFNSKIISKLLILSVLRYFVFTFQFVLVIKLFYTDSLTAEMIAGICIYFLLTTVLPMISVVEAAIRSAIALMIFSGSDISEIAIVLTAVILWILNIVVPSIIGYVIIVKEKFEISLFKK
ncbi:MAG TPA: lysylphosphatidylglycerol synthase domain-containing protein, partial [Bacteroidia bacterium]|nr:lysylphosphatidylglycerol synthase domain-containing protein [Bacteroidia bacterium]